MILDGINEQGEISESARNSVELLLKRSFRPEFLNRLDETVFYKPLTKENISAIMELLLNDLRERLADKHLTLAMTDPAKQYLIDTGYDPAYGARPLKRLLQSTAETLIARYIIGNDPEPDTQLTIDYDGEKLYIRV